MHSSGALDGGFETGAEGFARSRSAEAINEVSNASRPDRLVATVQKAEPARFTSRPHRFRICVHRDEAAAGDGQMPRSIAGTGQDDHMLNGSVFLRIAVLLAAALALTGLARYYFSQDGGPPASVQGAAEKPTPAEPAPAPRAEAPAPREPPSAQPSAPPPAQQPAQAGPTATLTPEPAPPPPIREAPAAIPAAPEAPVPQGEASVATAEGATGPRAVDLVDLNTAPLAQLNGLKGGAIGRAIVQHRPYASVDQLLSKRVLSRAIYQRIKDQVTVR